MTSFPIPGDFIISPLHDSLVGLNRREKVIKASKVDHSLKGVQEHSCILVDKPVSSVGGAKEFKEKKTKLAGRSKWQASKCTPLSNSVCDGAVFLKMTGQESKVSREDNKDEMKAKLLACELRKEEKLGSMSGRDCGKNEKQNSRGGFVEKLPEQRVTGSFKDAPAELSNDNKSKSSRISATLGPLSDVSKLEEDLDLPRQNVSHREHDNKKFLYKKEKKSFEGKNKSKGILGNGKPAAVSTKESLRVKMVAVPKDKKNTSQGVATCSDKMLKLKSHDPSKLTDSDSDLLSRKALEPADNKVDQRERDMADRPQSATLCDVEVDRKKCLDNPKEKLSCKKVGEKLIPGLSAKDAPNACPPVMENRLTSQMAPATVAPVIIEEDWVCCDNCQQWRLLPFGTKPEQLPEKWLCSMLNWL